MVQNDNPAKFAQLDDEITLVQMNLVTQQNLLGWTFRAMTFDFDNALSRNTPHRRNEGRQGGGERR